jgi:hypothetical protein
MENLFGIPSIPPQNESDPTETRIKLRLSDLVREKHLSNGDDDEGDELDSNSEDYSGEEMSEEDNDQNDSAMEDANGSEENFEGKGEEKASPDQYEDKEEENIDNESPEKNQGKEGIDGNEEEKIDLNLLKDQEIDTTRKYIRYNSKFAKQANIIQDFTGKIMTPEDRFKLSVDSAIKFNDRVMLNKIKVKEHMKRLERQKTSARASLENANVSFPSNCLPLYLYDENMNELFDLNGTTMIEKTTVEKFMNYNITHENSAGLPENYHRLGFYPGRRFQKRRRRRTSKMMEGRSQE